MIAIAFASGVAADHTEAAFFVIAAEHFRDGQRPVGLRGLRRVVEVRRVRSIGSFDSVDPFNAVGGLSKATPSFGSHRWIRSIYSGGKSWKNGDAPQGDAADAFAPLIA